MGVTIPVYGVPVRLSYSEAKAWSDHVLQQSGYDFSEDQKLSIVRTKLSDNAANMYADCIGAQHIGIQVPNRAFKDRDFLLTIVWKPDHHVERTRPLRIVVTNGTVDRDGQRPRDSVVLQATDHDAKTIVIHKADDPGGTTSIAVTIDGDTYPTIEVPIYKPLMTYHMVTIAAASPQSLKAITGNRCDTEADLIAQPPGGSIDGNAKSCILCVDAPSGAYIFPTSIEVSAGGNGGSHRQHGEATSDRICHEFNVPASSKGEANSLLAGQFSVRAAVPDRQPDQ